MSSYEVGGGPCSFSPNLCGALKVRILNGAPVQSSNNWMGLSSETRHFIDRRYLLSLEGGQEYINEMVSPTPPCTVMQGTRTPGGDRVVGMLRSRLYVSLYLPRGCPSGDPTIPSYPIGWSLLKLSNVLVIDALPVPLHIATRELRLNYPYDSSIDPRFERDAFPQEFHAHAYWHPTEENRHVFSEMSFTPMERVLERSQALQDGQTGRPSEIKMGKICLACGISGAAFQCSRCSAATYCSQSCQRMHWKMHKADCKKKDEKKI